MTFKGFNDSKRFLDRSHYLDMLEGKRQEEIRYFTKVMEKIILLMVFLYQ